MSPGVSVFQSQSVEVPTAGRKGELAKVRSVEIEEDDRTFFRSHVCKVERQPRPVGRPADVDRCAVLERERNLATVLSLDVRDEQVGLLNVFHGPDSRRKQCCRPSGEILQTEKRSWFADPSVRSRAPVPSGSDQGKLTSMARFAADGPSREPRPIGGAVEDEVGLGDRQLGSAGAVGIHSRGLEFPASRPADRRADHDLPAVICPVRAAPLRSKIRRGAVSPFMS